MILQPSKLTAVVEFCKYIPKIALTVHWNSIVDPLGYKSALVQQKITSVSRVLHSLVFFVKKIKPNSVSMLLNYKHRISTLN